MTKKQERQNAIEHLRDELKPGDDIYTILRNVSRSGMSRSIDLVIMRDNQPRQITYAAADAMNMKVDDKNGGIKIGGCGMDMGFSLVYDLGRTLYRDGFPLPGIKFYNGRWNGRNGSNEDHDNDGGYAFNQQWM